MRLKRETRLCSINTLKAGTDNDKDYDDDDDDDGDDGRNNKCVISKDKRFETKLRQLISTGVHKNLILPHKEAEDKYH